MNTNNLFFKTLDLSPSTFPNKSNNQHQHIRIADILADDDEEDSVVEFGMGGRRSDASTSLHCSFPHRIIVKWLAALRRRGKERTIFNVVPAQKREEKKEATVFAGGTLHTRRSENGLDGRDSSLPPSERQCRKDASFNLGVGCSLLYLVAASKNELARMVELRTQMEMLLQNVKVELQRKDAMCNPFESNDTLAYSTTDIPEGSNSNSRISLRSQTTSSVLQDSENIIVHDQPLESNTHQQEQHVEGMDELEAELEAELERLQIHLERENLMEHPQQQGIKDTASVTSGSLSFGEVINLQMGGTEMEYGVPPTELKRRLHELLEARQQERIEELEAALECAMHKLREKEIEVSWWKDTARLISQHVPGPSQLSS